MKYKFINHLPLFITAIAVGLAFFVHVAFLFLTLLPMYIGWALNYNLPGKKPIRRFAFRNITLPYAKKACDRDKRYFGEYVALSVCEDEYVQYGSKEFFRRKNEAVEQELQKAKKEFMVKLGMGGDAPPPEVLNMIIAKLKQMRDEAKKREKDEEDGIDNPGA
jgi:hypothetical protein